MVEAIHRIRTDPGRLTRAWFDALTAQGLERRAYVEMVSVVASTVIIDTLHQALGLAPPALPKPAAGAPTGHYNTKAVDAGAWVAVTEEGAPLPDNPAMPVDPFIHRALGLVPSAVALFFQTFRPHYALANIPLSISQAQAEFTAARVSALNQCFY